MITIDNTQECFVELWLLLERTRRLHLLQRKRYCIRNILKTWLGHRAKDDFIFEVCLRAEMEGWNELPLPQLEPRPHRELLRALTAVTLGLSSCKVDLHALDKAYSIAFPCKMSDVRGLMSAATRRETIILKLEKGRRSNSDGFFICSRSFAP